MGIKSQSLLSDTKVGINPPVHDVHKINAALTAMTQQEQKELQEEVRCRFEFYKK